MTRVAHNPPLRLAGRVGVRVHVQHQAPTLWLQVTEHRLSFLAISILAWIFRRDYGTRTFYTRKCVIEDSVSSVARGARIRPPRASEARPQDSERRPRDAAVHGASRRGSWGGRESCGPSDTSRDLLSWGPVPTGARGAVHPEKGFSAPDCIEPLSEPAHGYPNAKTMTQWHHAFRNYF